MKLHRIRLENFRGIEKAEVDFADTVTVVHGPNEVGKSSIPLAFRLLREVKAGSSRSEIKDVRPNDRDADPTVEIELTTGPYHLKYSKTWATGKRGSTLLTVLAPAPESIVGDAAHDRATEIFAETVDAQLWAALELVQGESFDQPTLANVEPLQAALTAQDSGDVEQVAGSLMEQIEAEYARWFTATGKPTGEFAKIGEQAKSAQERAEAAKAELSGAEKLVKRQEALASEVQALAAEQVAAELELIRCREAAKSIDSVRRDHGDAKLFLTEARAAVKDAANAEKQRRELISKFDEATNAENTASAELARCQERLAEASTRTEDEAAFKSLEDELKAARVSATAAANAVAAATDQRELQQLRARLEKAENAMARHRKAAAEIADNPVDAQLLAQLDEAQLKLATAEAAIAVGAARVRVESLGDLSVSSAPLLPEGKDVEVTQVTTVQVESVVKVVITPDDGATERAKKAEESAAELDSLLAKAGVADLSGARAAATQRQQSVQELANAVSDRDEALGSVEITSLQGNVDALVDRLAKFGQTDGLADLNSARERQDEANLKVEELADAVSKSAQDRKRLDARRTELRVESSSADSTLAAATETRDRAQKELAAAREAASDERVAEGLVSALAAEKAAESETTALAGRLEELGAKSLEGRLENAEAALKAATSATEEVRMSLAAVEGQIDFLGDKGLEDLANDAEAEANQLSVKSSRMLAKANAAKTLRNTFAKHADLARKRYVAPFQREISQLAAMVFGHGTTVEVSEDLQIVSRTLDGVTVGFSSLSGGAREQLSIISRMATARLVADDDGVPVILDDALGFADPTRRNQMVAMLGQVAANSGVQLIVLTCDQTRFATLAGATRVRLQEQI